LCRRKHQPDRVRPDDAKQEGLGRIQHHLLHAVLARQPGGDDNRHARPFLAQLADKTWHGLRRSDDDGQVGNAWDIRDRCKAAPSANVPVFWIDGKYLALEAACNDVVHHYAPHRTNADGRADDGYGFWVNGVFQVSDRHRHKPLDCRATYIPAATYR